MKQRTITGLVAASILALVLYFQTILLRPAIITLAFLGLYEFYHAFDGKNKVAKSITYIFTAINFIVIAIIEKNAPTCVNFLAGLMTVMMVYVITLLIISVFKHNKYTIIDIMVTLFGYIYVVLLFSFLYFLVSTKDAFLNIDESSYYTLFYLFILFSVSWGADMGGYFTGIVCGKHKLCEKLSPKKTIEGAIGGVLFSIAFGLAVVFVCNNNEALLENINAFWKIDGAMSIVYISILLGMLSVLAQIGDFVASGIKRFVQIKDYSNIMPGHGGVLDRFDSLIFVTPILYMIISFLN